MSTTPDTNTPEVKTEESGMMSDIQQRMPMSSRNPNYKQLQVIAKMFGVPCNLKKETLKMAIQAKMSGNDKELDALLKKVKEMRLLRKKQKEKAAEKAKALVKTVGLKKIEKNNSEMELNGCEDSDNIREVLRKMVKSRNVTIRHTTTNTRFQAVVNPRADKMRIYTVVKPTSTVTTPTNSRTYNQSDSNNNDQLKYTSTATISNVNNQVKTEHLFSKNYRFENGSSFAVTSVSNQTNTHTYSYNNNNQLRYPTQPASSVKGIIWKGYNNQQTFNERPTWSGFDNRVLCQQSTACPGYPPFPFNQPQNCNAQIDEMTCCPPKPTLNMLPGIEPHGSRTNPSYAIFKPGIKRTSSAVGLDDSLGFRLATNSKAASGYVESELQATNSCYNSFCPVNVAYQNKLLQPQNKLLPPQNNMLLPPFEIFINNNTSTDITDVISRPAVVNPCDVETDLSFLANVATKKAQQVIDEKRRQEHNGSLVVDDGKNSHRTYKNEFMIHDSKAPTQDVPTWQNVLNQMSNELMPNSLLFTSNQDCHLNAKVAFRNSSTISGFPSKNLKTPQVLRQCKYGCKISSPTRRQQIEHETHCFLQPVQCPMVSCTFVSQLASMSSHILNRHCCNVVSSSEGTFLLDFTNGRRLTEYSHLNFENGPKRLCFSQVVNGRLYIIRVIGDFTRMSVTAYIQYVNDYSSSVSTAALEVVSSDGIPYHWIGRVHTLSVNPVQLINRGHCLTFNMSYGDISSNHFLLYTKIWGYTKE